MGVPLERIRQAVKRSKNEATISGVEEEYLDAVAAVLAVFALTGVGTHTAVDQHDVVTTILALPETFSEWAYHYKLSTHYDRFLACMVFLFERGQSEVTTTEILEMYDKARWKRPANAADIFAKGAERRLFAEVDDAAKAEQEKKHWRITRTGYSHFESLRFENE